jgi:hypothetical protein
MSAWYLPRRRQLRQCLSCLKLIRPMAWASIFITAQFTYIFIAYQRPLRERLYHWDKRDSSSLPPMRSTAPDPHSNRDSLLEFPDLNQATVNQITGRVKEEIKFVHPVFTTFPTLQHHQEKKSLGSFPVTGSPEIAGWTPDVFPDPLVDPVRCSLSFLPDSDIAMSRTYRLCDPDWVLGEVYLQEVALSLRNFSDMFSNQWAVGVVGENRRQLNAVFKSHSFLFPPNQFASTPIQKSGFTLIRRFISAPSRLLLNEDKPTDEDRINNRKVSLGVAVVRKVCQVYVLLL